MMQKSVGDFWKESAIDAGSAQYLEDLFETYLSNADDIPPEWLDAFNQLPIHQNGGGDISHRAIRQEFYELAQRTLKNTQAHGTHTVFEYKNAQVHDLINSYRLHGHAVAQIDPLNQRTVPVIPELSLEFHNLTSADLEETFDPAGLGGAQDRKLKDILEDLKSIYCGTCSPEFMHISDSKERLWVQNEIETILKNRALTQDCRKKIYENLVAADGLEKYLGSKYPGAKRFGLEGGESFLVCLSELIDKAGETGTKEIVIGMAHRGRLNVLVNIFGKSPSELFDEFEGKVHSEKVESGDVKYHQGFSSDIRTKGGNVHISLSFNPSHLEIVSPVVCGSVRARTDRRKDTSYDQVLSILIHGDAAFAGQGVVMETMNMSQTKGYATGGSIHVIINNQVGFTTSNPRDARSTMHCSDLGKMLQIPIIHVNADDPETVFLVTDFAIKYRNTFKKDVIIDLVCYRRHGHNEADEPSATQPQMYQIIRGLTPVRAQYGKTLVEKQAFTESEIQKTVDEYKSSLDQREKTVARNIVDDGWVSEFSQDWGPYIDKDWRAPYDSSVSLELIQEVAAIRDAVPEGFELHPRVKKIVDDRQKMTQGLLPLDWGYAETMAYGTLIHQGYSVRLSGQDCGRGTFFHRHAVFHNQKEHQAHTSLEHVGDKKAQFTVIDSLLSEAAVLGFEYGYSTSDPESLVIWEAQFGDFANGAQVVIDQFISSGEMKWGRLSGLTMLLPHGYEGQGPEHSSARLERFLQLCAQHNIQVCVPTTPAQVFHMLRRQVIRPMRRPLIVMSPKSLLRHKKAVSSIEELHHGEFQLVIDDDEPTLVADMVDRVVLCSGKVFYDLLDYRELHQNFNTAIIRVEQLYPFPEIELTEILEKYRNLKTCVWCQEEPQNQGSWYSIQHQLYECIGNKSLFYAGREATAAPAAGYMHLHNKQRDMLLAQAFNIK